MITKYVSQFFKAGYGPVWMFHFHSLVSLGAEVDNQVFDQLCFFCTCVILSIKSAFTIGFI